MAESESNEPKFSRSLVRVAEDEAWRAGYEAAKAQAAAVARHRATVSREAEGLVRRGLLYTNTPTAGATERAAALEAEHIEAKILAMEPTDE